LKPEHPCSSRLWIFPCWYVLTWTTKRITNQAISDLANQQYE